MRDIVDVLDRLVERAQTAAGPDEGVEVYGVDAAETSVRAYGGEVESLSSARTRGVGIRVIDGGRVGYAHTVDLDDAALDAALADARRNARAATPDPANVLPAAERAEHVADLYVAAQQEAEPSRKVEIALDLEAAVTGRGDARIKGVDAAVYGDAVTTAAIRSTTGVRGSYRRSDAYLLVEVLAEADGQTQSAYGIDMARSLDDLSVATAADEAVERATRLLGAAKPPSSRLPVVFDPFVTASFLGVIAGPLTAEAVQRGRSLFSDKVGTAVAPAHVRLIDDGRHPRGPASAPWDGEGTPSQRTVLIDDGVLQGFLHNATSAARDGVASTGNASRSTFKAPPGLSPTNLYLEPGPLEPAALVADVGTGFYCQQVMGLHSGANPISGDFSVGAAGVMIRDGAFAEPVREATIAGTLPTMLTGISAIGADLRFLPFGGGMGGLTVVVDGMTLGGT